MNQEARVQQEDEIDLRELWQIAVKRKVTISIVTLCVACSGAVYTFFKDPIYEVKAVFEIGSYTISNTNSITNSVLIEPPLNLIKRLDIVYIANKNLTDKGYLKTVELVKGSINLVEVVVRANSNEDAINQTNLIADKIYIRHQQLLESYIALMKSKIKNLEQEREELIGEKEVLSRFIKEKIENIDKILKDNPAVAAVYTIDLNTKTSQLSELKDKIFKINNQLNDLSIAMSPNNLKPTSMMGIISHKDHPIEPKKVIILAVSFATGLVLSIFLVFFLEFIGKKSDE